MQETGHGLKLHRYDWTDEQMAQAIDTLLTDHAMHARLARAKAHMQAESGTEKAARLLNDL